MAHRSNTFFNLEAYKINTRVVSLNNILCKKNLGFAHVEEVLKGLAHGMGKSSSI